MPVRFLIHERDAKFPVAFDALFTSEDVTIIRTPVRAPNADAFVERWVRSAGEECLDRSLILGEGHLRHVLTEYVTYYNTARLHQGLGQQCPMPLGNAASGGPIKRRNILGACCTTIIGVLHKLATAADRLFARYGSAKAIEKHWCLVLVAYSFLHLACLPPPLMKASLPVKTISEALRQQAQALIEAVIVYAHDHLQRGQHVKEVLGACLSSKVWPSHNTIASIHQNTTVK